MKHNTCSLLLGSFNQVLAYSFCTDTMRRSQSQSLVTRVGLNKPVQVPILGGGKPILITVPTTVTHPGPWGGNTPLSSRSPRLSILFCLLWVTLSAICHPGFASSFTCIFFFYNETLVHCLGWLVLIVNLACSALTDSPRCKALDIFVRGFLRLKWREPSTVLGGIQCHVLGS